VTRIRKPDCSNLTTAIDFGRPQELLNSRVRPVLASHRQNHWPLASSKRSR
jgi:hypothetical protein